MKKRFRVGVEKNLFHIPISLDKETNDWLYNSGILRKISGGYKLPKSYIIRSLINAFIRLNIDLKNIKTEKDLEKKIFQSLRRFQRMNRAKQDLPNQNRNLLVASIGMGEKQVSFIDEIAREMRFSGGREPSRSSILNTFIRIAMVTKFYVSGVKSEKGF